MNTVDEHGAVGDEVTVKNYDTTIWGDSENPDCPQDGNGGYCFKVNKYGVKLHSITNHGGTVFPTSKSSIPYHKLHGIAILNG